jgi:hypothetical protein
LPPRARWRAPSELCRAWRAPRKLRRQDRIELPLWYRGESQVRRGRPPVGQFAPHFSTLTIAAPQVSSRTRSAPSAISRLN